MKANQIAVGSAVCVGCARCSEVCPAQIDIPAVLKICEQHPADALACAEKLRTVDSKGTPMDCIECGACSAHCPQKIDVKEIMRRMAMLEYQNFRSA